MQKIMTRGLIAAAIAFGGIAAGGAASAAPGAGTQSSSAGRSGDSVVSDANGYLLVGVLPTLSECATIGREGAEQKLWESWYCSPYGTYWGLWAQ